MQISTTTFKSVSRSQNHTKSYVASLLLVSQNHLSVLVVTLDCLPWQFMELSATDMEPQPHEISFEELLAKEKEDTAFWQRNGKLRSFSSK